MPSFNINDNPERYQKMIRIVMKWIMEVYSMSFLGLKAHEIECIENIVSSYIREQLNGELNTDYLQLYTGAAANTVKKLYGARNWVRVAANAYNETQFNSQSKISEEIYFRVCKYGSSLITNRQCSSTNTDKKHDILDKCSTFPGIVLKQLLGKGVYGEVFLGESERGKVAVKFIIESLNRDNFEDLNKEITISYNMGMIGLGPKIYDAFYVIDNKNKYKQVIIMEYYKYDGKTALQIASKAAAKDIIIQMILLIKEMVSYGMYCTDIKPANFVVDESMKKVRLIDFGSEWCPEKLPTSTETELFQLLSFQLYMIIKIYMEIELNNDELNKIFCKYAIPDLHLYVRSYYNGNLLLKHYIQYDIDTAVNNAKNLSNCGGRSFGSHRKSRRKSYKKRKSRS